MANMNDVAKLAGVSRGTVSNYINGIKIKDHSRKKIEDAINQLDYVPNQAARALKMQRSNYVVFILPTIWNPFFSELTYYLQLELKEHGLKMLLCNSQNEYQQELDYIQMAKEQKVMGIITISYSDISHYLTSDLPIVSIERYFNDSIPFITSDNFGGGRLAAEILTKKGSKRLLMILRKIENNLGLLERKSGFVSYCEENNISYEVYLDEGDSKGFRKRVHKWIRENFKERLSFDGIFAATDRYAEYCLTAFENLQWQIPKHVQLIGFDGSKSYENEELIISTIRQPVEEIAEISVKELMALEVPRIKEKKKKYILPVSFAEAKTTR